MITWSVADECSGERKKSFAISRLSSLIGSRNRKARLSDEYVNQLTRRDFSRNIALSFLGIILTTDSFESQVYLGHFETGKLSYTKET